MRINGIYNSEADPVRTNGELYCIGNGENIYIFQMN